MCKKLYGSALVLGASFVTMNSVSYSMIADANRIQHGWYAPQSQCCNSNNYFNNDYGVNQRDFQQNSFANDDCSPKFQAALNDFHSVMSRPSVIGGVNLTDFPAVISAQNRLIDAMSEVISFLLRMQQQQVDRDNALRDVYMRRGDLRASPFANRQKPEKEEKKDWKRQLSDEDYELINMYLNYDKKDKEGYKKNVDQKSQKVRTEAIESLFEGCNGPDDLRNKLVENFKANARTVGKGKDKQLQLFTNYDEKFKDLLSRLMNWQKKLNEQEPRQ